MARCGRVFNAVSILLLIILIGESEAALTHTGAAGAVEEHAHSEVAEWAWRQEDTDALRACVLWSLPCVLVTALALATAYAGRRAADGSGTDVECGKAAEVVSGGAVPEAPPAAPTCGFSQGLRLGFLVLFGFSPLLVCLCIGEGTHNTLIAMTVMHAGAMLMMPALFYMCQACARVGEDPWNFYFELLQIPRNACWKCFRGNVLGVIFFTGILGCYMAFHCRTAHWILCVNDFSKPLEAYGFRQLGFPFRLVVGLYFTFWNPFVEEFFWRVFLHRELGSVLGIPPDDAASSCDVTNNEVGDVTNNEVEEGGGRKRPWLELRRDVVASLSYDFSSFRVAVLKWGVSMMYASYHMWPISILFGAAWPFYGVCGFVFLAVLGRFFLLLRESADFGLLSAYALHAWIDGAFAVVCLFDIHPAWVFSG